MRSRTIIIAILLVLVMAGNASAVTVGFSTSNYAAGYAYKTGDSYPPTTAQTFQMPQQINTFKNNSSYRVDTGCFIFNTSSIPDNATIVSASLYVKPNSGPKNADGRNLNFDYYSGSFNNDCWTVEVTPNAGYASVSSFSYDTTKEIVLSNVTSISKTGDTGFICGISGGEPSGFNSVPLYGEYESGGARRPYLSVTYTTGYSKKILGVTSAAKVNGVAVPAKVNGL